MSLTEYHAAYYAHELSRRHFLGDSEKIASALNNTQKLLLTATPLQNAMMELVEEKTIFTVRWQLA